jgi:uncharacterized protein
MFLAVLLGIFLEAVPFLLAGSLVSGLVEVYVNPDRFAEWRIWKSRGAVLVGVLMGLVLPVCECGVIPVGRRLMRKGLPLRVGISFIVAAPVLNPITIFSTGIVFGWGLFLWARIAATVLVALLVTACVVLLCSSPLREEVNTEETCSCDDQPKPAAFWRVLWVAGEDFLDLGKYLVLGSAVAAALQTFVPHELVQSIGHGPILSVLSLQLLAFVLSLCSSVDSFIAQALGYAFQGGALLAFLVFGPMVDIKSTLMLNQVFRGRAVVVLIGAAWLFSALIGILWNIVAP